MQLLQPYRCTTSCTIIDFQRRTNSTIHAAGHNESWVEGAERQPSAENGFAAFSKFETLQTDLSKSIQQHFELNHIQI